MSFVSPLPAQSDAPAYVLKTALGRITSQPSSPLRVDGKLLATGTPSGESGLTSPLDAPPARAKCISISILLLTSATFCSWGAPSVCLSSSIRSESRLQTILECSRGGEGHSTSHISFLPQYIRCAYLSFFHPGKTRPRLIPRQ